MQSHRPVADFMSRKVSAITPTSTLTQARRRMGDLCVRHLPVIEESGRLVGVLTERDLFVVSALRDLDPGATVVRTVMTPHPFCVLADAAVGDVARELDHRRISSALVTDAEGRVVGIFTEADAVRALVSG